MTPSGRTLRLGLIGAGPWGRNLIRTIAAVDGVRLSRLASTRADGRALAGEDCTVSADWRQVAAADDIDGVVVATPPALHGIMTRAAVAAGTPVLVEKPLTMDAAEAADLAAFVEARGGFVLVDHIHLFSPAWQALKREARALGPVRHIHAEAGGWGPFRPDVPVLWDWGPHDLALAMDLLGGPPQAIRARIAERRQTPDGAGETVQMEAEFAGSTHARFTLSNLFDGRRRTFAVQFDACTLIYDDAGPDKLTRRAHGGPAGDAAGPAEPVPVDDEAPLECVVRAFAEGIRGASRDTASVRLGVGVVAALADAERSMAKDN